METNNNTQSEALKAINCIDIKGLKRLLCELVESDIFDGGLINKTIAAVEKARRVLAEPPRNCDLPQACNAKLREALIKAKSAICHFARHQCQSLSWEDSNLQANCGDVLCSWRGLCRAKTTINAALSAPPRNCDRFADELDAQLAFLNEVWLISVDRETMLERDKYENWTDAMRTRYGRWLLAPVTEKGDTDGR